MAIDDLYERDFYVWTQEQAAALRAAGKAGGRSNAVDWNRVAEEVEDVGKSEYREAGSLITRIVEHLFKLAWSECAEPKAGWRSEIVHFRARLRRTLTPTLRTRMEAELTEIHADAIAAALPSFLLHEPEAARDETLRWTLPQILGETDDPLEA
jgi:hypothetical protein